VSKCETDVSILVWTWPTRASRATDTKCGNGRSLVRISFVSELNLRFFVVSLSPYKTHPLAVPPSAYDRFLPIHPAILPFEATNYPLLTGLQHQ